MSNPLAECGVTSRRPRLKSAFRRSLAIGLRSDCDRTGRSVAHPASLVDGGSVAAAQAGRHERPLPPVRVSSPPHRRSDILRLRAHLLKQASNGVRSSPCFLRRVGGRWHGGRSVRFHGTFEGSTLCCPLVCFVQLCFSACCSSSAEHRLWCCLCNPPTHCVPEFLIFSPSLAAGARLERQS